MNCTPPKRARFTLSVTLAILSAAGTTYATESLQVPSVIGPIDIVGGDGSANSLGIVGTGIVGGDGSANSLGIVGTGIVGGDGSANSLGIVGTGIVGGDGSANSLGIVGTGRFGTSIESAVDPAKMTIENFRIWATQANVGGLPLVAYGPIDVVIDDNTLVVLGQTVHHLGRSADSVLEPGDTVAVFGLVSENGLHSDTILISSSPSVDGSSLVFLSGIAEPKAANANGFIVGELNIELGSAGTSPASYEIEAGQYVEIVGYRFDATVVAELIGGI